MSERLLIERIGAKGDGLAQGPYGPLHVAFALPGESVMADVTGDRARLIEVISPSPERVAAPCQLFQRCGGCATQHWAAEPTLAWKRDLVVEALRRAGVDAPVADIIDAHGAGRRRVVLHARRSDDGRVGQAQRAAWDVGFMAARSHDLVPVAVCLVLTPALARGPMIAQAVAQALGGRGKPLDLHLTATETGIDIDVRGHGAPSERERAALVTLSHALDLTRVSMHGDIVAERRAPLLNVGRAALSPPPGGFLQATAAGEATLARLAGEAVSGARRIADLFSGAGAFALRLAETGQVDAFDADAAAIRALDRARRTATGLKAITPTLRDLFRRPLVPLEWAIYDAVVMDPPRQGAEAQAIELARPPVRAVGKASRMKRLAYVSCNPTSFTRDAAILVAGGWTLQSVTPVDQFRYSAHVELVGAFTR